MGQKTTQPPHGQPPRVHPSGLPGDAQGQAIQGGSSSGGGGSPSGDGGMPEIDIIDVALTRVNALVLSKTKVRDAAWVSGSEVHVKDGRLGDIHRDLLRKIESGGYKNGAVINTSVVTVRLFR